MNELERRKLCTIIIKQKRHLSTIRGIMRKARRNRETLAAALSYGTEQDMPPAVKMEQRVCRNMLDEIDKTIADARALQLDAGKAIMQLGWVADKYLSESDYRGLFNISHTDMQELLRETEGSIFDRIMVSWWAGDTVELFGNAIFEYMRSTPHGKALLDEGFEQFVRSTGLPVYVHDRQGRLRPRLQLVK